LGAAGWPAWLGSCKRLATRPGWQGACADAQGVDPGDATAQRCYFESHFTPYRIVSSAGPDTGLITGYYETQLSGGLDPQPGRVPIYGVPDDLLTIDLGSLYPELKGQRVRGRLDGHTVRPYWTRADIDKGKDNLDGKVLAWADDPIDAFFLEVQGSGRMTLDDGRRIRLAYADQNGQPYKSIGKWLVDQGQLTVDQASMQSIREWGIRHPDRLEALLDENQSYVFFRIQPPPAPGSLEAQIDGPTGSLGVPLLAQRTVA
jgi:membrane-bound lytic murein transglycosylase A